MTPITPKPTDAEHNALIRQWLKQEQRKYLEVPQAPTGFGELK